MTKVLIFRFLVAGFYCTKIRKNILNENPVFAF